jgi:hypothetical protein
MYVIDSICVLHPLDCCFWGSGMDCRLGSGHLFRIAQVVFLDSLFTIMECFQRYHTYVDFFFFLKKKKKHSGITVRSLLVETVPNLCLGTNGRYFQTLGESSHANH